ADLYKKSSGFGPFLYKHPNGKIEFVESDEPTNESRGEKLLELCASLETNAGLMVMQDCTLSEPISFPANKPSNIICTADIYFSSAVDYFADLSNGQRVYILNAGDWASQKTSG